MMAVGRPPMGGTHRVSHFLLPALSSTGRVLAMQLLVEGVFLPQVGP